MFSVHNEIAHEALKLGVANFIDKNEDCEKAYNCLSNSIKEICKKSHFYSERYWRATKERHAKGNPDAVQYLLGHSSLAYVQIYAQLASQCFGDQEYDVVEVRDPESLREVGKKGYEQFAELGGVLYFRKPKTD